MICLHRLKGEKFWLNHRMIETMEANPDNVISLTNEHKYIVRERPEEVRALVWEFERKIFPSQALQQTENQE